MPDWVNVWAPHVLSAAALALTWWVSRSTQKRDDARRAEDQKRDDARRVEEDRRWTAERAHEAERLKRETDAALRMVSEERDRWRREWRGQKRADVAARSIVESLKLVDALDVATDVLVRAVPTSEEVGAELRRRWAAVDAALVPFRAVKHEAEAMLPGEAVKAVAELDAHAEQLRRRLVEWIAATGMDKIDKAVLALGSHPESETGYHRRAVLFVLRPLAGAEENPGTAPAPPSTKLVRITHPIGPGKDGVIEITGPAVEVKVTEPRLATPRHAPVFDGPATASAPGAVQARVDPKVGDSAEADDGEEATRAARKASV